MPWCIKNIDQAESYQASIKLMYGQIHSHDELGCALTQILSLFCIVMSVISIYKCTVIAMASERHLISICLYSASLIASITFSLFTYENFNGQLLGQKESMILFAQPVLALIRAVIFYKVYFNKHVALPRPLKVAAAVAAELSHTTHVTESTDTVKVVPGKQSLFSLILEVTHKGWFIGYWFVYALVACIFYNEVVKYIAEEHMTLENIMKFVLV
jgi:hypothetical protein